jgi:1-acyl-sn-glycerol-3-phosphate acyltransferase
MTAENWLQSSMELPRVGAAGWLRVVFRGVPLAVVIYGGLALLLLVRLAERPICGMDRPVSPWITQGVCRAAVWLLGLRLVVRGQPMRGRGAVVANHASWLDIFVLNAVDRVYFVSKAEVAGWAGIGWLARATGTVFITRKGAEAREQQRLFEARLRAGHRLCFFPEGTSTDSRRILPFKSTLFAAFFTHGMEHVVQLQPVTVVYRPTLGADARFFGWWGEMDFAPHLLSVLAARRGGEVEVVLHPPKPADAFGDRKALAAWCEATVRGAHPDGQVAGWH